MKANELMIGDWVIGYSGEPFEIGIIDPDFLYWDEIQPIPLTKDILEKNDWKRLTSPEGEDVFVLDLGTTVLWWFVKDKELVLIGGSHLKIEYVHQLQHALRLCGIEKEIML